jgi:hypothetical protein
MDNEQTVTEEPVQAVLEKIRGPRVYAAIANVMADIGVAGIGKDRSNQQQGFKFRGIDDVYNALSGPLSARGLMLLPRVLSRDVVERTTKNGGALFYVSLDVEFDLVCAEDGSKHTVRVAGEAMDSGDKATNKAMSAAYKYACMQVFCIPTEGDNDADSTTHEVQSARPLAQASSTAPSQATTQQQPSQAKSTPTTTASQSGEPRATEAQRARIRELMSGKGISLTDAQGLSRKVTGHDGALSTSQADTFIAALEVFGAT